MFHQNGYMSAQNQKLNMSMLSHFQQELQQNRLIYGRNSLLRLRCRL